MKQEIFNQYTEKVAEAFGIDQGDLFIKDKRQHIADARHMLYYLCINRPMKIVFIQKYMLERGYDIKHSSIIHGVSKIEDKLKTDRDYVDIIRSIQ